MLRLLLAAAAAGVQAQGHQSLIARINAEDKAASADAQTEYRRRLDLLPRLAQERTSGSQDRPGEFSIDGLRRLGEELKKEHAWIEDARKKVEKLKLKEIKGAVPRFPGPPGSDLAARKTYWAARRIAYQDLADRLGRRLDPANAKSAPDEFGDAVPEALPAARALEQKRLEEAKAGALRLAEQIDAQLEPVNRNFRLGLPRLSGQALAKLLETLKTFRGALRSAKIKDEEGPAAAQEAHAVLPLVAAEAAELEHEARRWARAERRGYELEGDIANLSQVKPAFASLVRAIDAILADAKLDEDFASGASGELYEPAQNRKLAALEPLPAVFKEGRDVLEKGLLSYQKRRVDEASRGGELESHYRAQTAFLAGLSSGS